MNNWQIKHCFQFWNLEYPALCTRFKIERRKRFLLFYPGSRVSFWFLITRKSTINKIGPFDQCREQRCLKIIPMSFLLSFLLPGFSLNAMRSNRTLNLLGAFIYDGWWILWAVVCCVRCLRSQRISCLVHKVSISLRRNTEEEFYSPDFCSWRRETIKWPFIFCLLPFRDDLEESSGIIILNKRVNAINQKPVI